MRALLRETLLVIIIAAILYFGLQLIVQDYSIREYSMEPNFTEGQRVLANKIVYKFHGPERGDVVIFRPPPPYDSQEIPFIKRIIGLPGETVEIKNGSVYINSTELDEPYITQPPRYTLSKIEIPEDNYFVLGDNRNNSNDSHTGWTVPRENIIGKAWLSIWPLGRWGLASNCSLSEQPVSSVSR